MSKIKFFLNGEERFVANQTTIAKLIEDLDLDTKKIAIEKDLVVINSSQFCEIMIDEGSRIEIVHFIGGG